MKDITTPVVLVLVLGLNVATLAMAQDLADEAQYEAVLANTQAVLADVASKAQLWTTSDKLLKQAAEVATSGDYQRAIELANEAGEHGKLALAQAEKEKHIWHHRVPE